MALNSIGVLSTGEMGSSIARTLHDHGITVLTNLDGRSEQTRFNAKSANARDVSLEELVKQTDIVLSVVPSEAAQEVAMKLSDEVSRGGERLLFADLNPIAPPTIRGIAEDVDEMIDIVDGGIIGPAGDLSRASFYFSGPQAADATVLSNYGLHTVELGPQIGQASGLKLCYAGMTKGLSALGMDLLLSATALNIEPAVVDLYEDHLPGIMPFLDGRLPGNPKRANRRAQEMEEWATMLEEYGIDDAMAQASADRLHWLASLGLDTDAATDGLETARRVFDVIE